MGDTLGKHVLARLEGIPFKILDDIDFLLSEAGKSIDEAKMHAESYCSKKFEPQGVTILILLTESHLAIHTWPERGCMALECFTCGTEGNPYKAINYWLKKLSPTSFKVEALER